MPRVVVVESDQRSRERIEQFLKEAGHSVSAFDDAAGALQLVASSPEHADVMVLAWDLSGSMKMGEVLIRLAQDGVAFPRLVISPVVNLSVTNRIHELGAADLLSKPVQRERLLEAVWEQVHGIPAEDPLLGELGKELIGRSPLFLEAMGKLCQTIKHPQVTVLLIGDNGSGKEVFAQLLHRMTQELRSRPEPDPKIVPANADASKPRRGKTEATDSSTKNAGTLEAVNLAGLSESLIESELFGHEEGAFSDAKKQHIGAFERAGDGTLFLDEIGYLKFDLQPKLLRAIEAREFTRVGGSKRLPFRTRLACATNRNLVEEVKLDKFRKDLYYRISEFEIRIPPLCDRKEDLPLLANHFLKDTGHKLTRETLTILEAYPFPGNVRELKNILSQARAVCPGRNIRPVDLPATIMDERQRPPREKELAWPETIMDMTYDDAQKEIERRFNRVYLLRKLEEANFNREKAAELMEVTPKTFRTKLKECGLGYLVREREGDRG